MVKITSDPEISVELYPENNIAVLKIQDIEIGRVSFDTYENDNHSVVFFVGERDAINIDYDVLRIW